MFYVTIYKSNYTVPEVPIISYSYGEFQEAKNFLKVISKRAEFKGKDVAVEPIEIANNREDYYYIRGKLIYELGDFISGVTIEHQYIIGLETDDTLGQLCKQTPRVADGFDHERKLEKKDTRAQRVKQAQAELPQAHFHTGIIITEFNQKLAEVKNEDLEAILKVLAEYSRRATKEETRSELVRLALAKIRNNPNNNNSSSSSDLNTTVFESWYDELSNMNK